MAKFTAWLSLLIVYILLTVLLICVIFDVLPYRRKWGFIQYLWLLMPIFLLILSEKNPKSASVSNKNNDKPRVSTLEKLSIVSDDPRQISKVIISPTLSRSVDFVVKHQKQISKIMAIPPLLVVIGVILFIVFAMIGLSGGGLCC